MDLLLDHVDAIIAAAVVMAGSILVHVKTVGRIEGAIEALRDDIKEIKSDVRRVGKRFHWLNNFSMGLSGSIRKLCEQAGIQENHQVEGYDFEGENGEKGPNP